MSDLLLKMPLQYEPLRQNRFLFRFPSDLGIQEWWVASGSRPNIQLNPVAIPFLNAETYVTGQAKWQPIQLQLRSAIGPSTDQAVMEWVRLAHESLTGRDGYAAAYTRDAEIDMLDPTGVAVSKWILKNCFPADANFGQLTYSSAELATVDITLQYYYAILAY